MAKITKKHYQELYKLFISLKSKKEVELLLKDILTPQELDNIVERWQLIKMIAQGKPQRKIKNNLGISISKITRGSKEFKYGHGGFELMLKRLDKK